MPSPTDILTARFADAITKAFGVQHAGVDPLIRPTQNPNFGDYQANLAMSLAKTLSAKPREVAVRIVESLQWQDLCGELPGVAGPGFINLKLSDKFLTHQAAALEADDRLGVARPEKPRTVIVDYSGPNVAKEMHVGHLRSTVIGDAIARVLEFTGQQVIRQNHMGDWGTQFGMLIEHMIDEGADRRDSFEVRDLNLLYQNAKKKFDGDQTFAERARKRVVMLQGGDADTLKLWRTLMEESKRHFNEIYTRLGVSLTDKDIRSESFFNPTLPAIAAELEKSGVATLSQGALCAFPPGFLNENGEPTPVIVRKTDGGYGYATTDLAALKFRLKELHADRIVYVTDSRQKQHFAMVFKVVEMARWNGTATEPTAARRLAAESFAALDHVPFGTVLGEDGKPFKTRSGETVKLADLLDEAEQRAFKIVSEKNAEIPEATRKAIAHAVGIGAIKYADLSNDRVKDYVFAWDRMLSFDGNTAPYLQNAYVRVRSIFRKAGLIEETRVAPGSTQSGLPGLGGELKLTDPAERALMLKLLQFAPAVESVASSLEPHRLCTYLYELAATYHQFYEKCPVLSAPDQAIKSARLRLCDLTARTLATGLGLLGIDTVEQM